MAAVDRIIEDARKRRSLPTPGEQRAIRKRAGLSQADVGAALGVGRVTVARWELGTHEPTRRIRLEYIDLLERLKAEA
jgi:transcriptional regulator with XRE-family HTH domain